MSSEPIEVAQASRLRPRIGLGRLFMWIALATVIASHVWTSYRLFQAERELRHLRRAMGILAVEDRSRIHVLPVDVQEPLTWRYRLYLPEDREYRIYEVTHNIPQEGFPPEDGASYSSIRSGETTITLKVQKDPKGHWIASVYTDSGSASFGIPLAHAQWLEKPTQRNFFGPKAENFAADERIVLMRLRATSTVPRPATTPGVMFWIAPKDVAEQEK